MDGTGGHAAHDPGAERGPRVVMEAYASALRAGDAGLAADLYAANGLLTSTDERLSGRSGITGWHEDLLARGAVEARPSGQGNDTGRLEVSSPVGRFVVDLDPQPLPLAVAERAGLDPEVLGQLGEALVRA